jgi:hypothetical protein
MQGALVLLATAGLQKSWEREEDKALRSALLYVLKAVKHVFIRE